MRVTERISPTVRALAAALLLLEHHSLEVLAVAEEHSVVVADANDLTHLAGLLHAHLHKDYPIVDWVHPLNFILQRLKKH